MQTLVVMLLEKSPLAANRHALPMKRKVVIQSAFDLEYTCVVEHVVYVSDSPEARVNILGMEFLEKLGGFFYFWEPHAFFNGLSRQVC